MSFETTTRKMADEVAAECRLMAENLTYDYMETPQIKRRLVQLAEQVEKLAMCVSRRFPGHEAAASPSETGEVK